jgi:6-hydroxycyclohex-1-ene-1-carbonyl-CoA dehydrogenase
LPARKLCVVDTAGKAKGLGQASLDLWELAVVADAATTPFQAIRRAGLKPGDLAVFIGVGGVGGYGVQIAAALGAQAVAIDIDDAKLEALRRHGAAFTVNARGKKPRELRDEIRGFAKGQGLGNATWRIFETSGTAVGQETAFGLLSQGSSLSVVGFTMDTVTLRLSNMMAFDAEMYGNWGCDPDLYPEAVGLVLAGKVDVRDFSEPRPLASINEVFAEAHAGKLQKRVVLRP